MSKSRRRSNSSVVERANSFKTKFDVNEPEPVFEEDLHGATAPGYHDDEMKGHKLEKQTTVDSNSSSVGSLDELDTEKNM